MSIDAMPDQNRYSVDYQVDFYNKYWRELEPFGSYKVIRIKRILDYLVFVRRRLKDLNILDLGCGDGRAVAVWSILGKSSGLDLSTEAMETAKKMFPGLAFSSENATRTNYNSGSFNVVISQEVLEHIEDQRSYIQECSRLLATGGYLILTTPNKYYFDRVAGGNYSKQPIENILEARTLKLLINEFFEIEKFESIIAARGSFGLYKFLCSRFLISVLVRLRLDFIRVRLMEKFRFGVHLCLVARKK